MYKNNNHLENAKILRKNMTPQEKHLWYDFLKAYPIKIYKQRIIDEYIVDFYCHKSKVAIEIDGYLHYTADGKRKDELRTKELQKYGILVIRFSDSDIDNQFENVCKQIDEIIKKRMGM
jgi:very-short-patch-repair endonuclease